MKERDKLYQQNRTKLDTIHNILSASGQNGIVTKNPVKKREENNNNKKKRATLTGMVEKVSSFGRRGAKKMEMGGENGIGN